MRRFELTDGSSDKFWEVERNGSEVTVRYGRIGTAGQSRTKDLGTDDKAIAHETKLVREKTGKGYLETGDPSPARDAEAAATATAPTSASTTASTSASTTASTLGTKDDQAATSASPPGGDAIDERSVLLGTGMRRQVAPLRHLGDRPKVTLAAAKGEKALRDLQAIGGDRAGHYFDHENTDADLRDAAATERYEDGDGGEPTPLGTAAYLVALAAAQDETCPPTVADLIFKRHGPVFLAETATWLGGIDIDFDRSDRDVWYLRGGAEAWIIHAPDRRLEVSRFVPFLGRVRTLLASLDDEAWAAVIETLEAVRGSGSLDRSSVASLITGRPDWVRLDLPPWADIKDDLRFPTYRSLSEFASVLSEPDHVEAFAVFPGPHLVEVFVGQMASLVAHLGEDALPILNKRIDPEREISDSRRKALAAIAAIPGDDAFDVMIDAAFDASGNAALLAAARERPRRTVRCLASRIAAGGAGIGAFGEVLRAVAAEHPDAVAEERAMLAPELADAIAAYVERSDATSDAEIGSLPEILVTPPWERKKPRVKPVVIADLPVSPRAELVWAPGEQQEWAETRIVLWQGEDKDWPATIKRLRSGHVGPYWILDTIAAAPAELAAPLVTDGARIPGLKHVESAVPLQRILGVHGEAAIEFVTDLATGSPSGGFPALLPIESAAVAALVADGYVRLKSRRMEARAWIERHPGAADLLIPDALRKAGKSRTSAEAVLTAIAANGHRDDVLAAAAGFGDDARAAIETLLDRDPSDDLPNRIPAVPDWLMPTALPQVLLADRSAAVPPAAANHIVTMLAISKPGEPYVGLETVQRATDPASLAAFALAIFDQWAAANFPSKEGWALSGLGALGDDEAVRRLAPMIRVWPKGGGSARAVTGLDVLTEIGSEVALMHLHRLSEKAPTPGLRATAKEKIGEVAANLGLTPEELADRLVPDFGLDTDGRMVLDFGSRSFTVSFDEMLKPVLLDDTGKVRKSLPKAAAADDADLAADAHKTFTALKKDVRTVAGDQLGRLERAMVNQRRWSGEDFRRYFVDHSLVWNVARRLVWASFDGDTPTATFRIAEDRTFADASDDAWELPEEASIGLVHRLDLTAAEAAAWGETFADYELLQPFEQLARRVFELTDDERTGTTVQLLDGHQYEPGRILGLISKGWVRGDVLDGGVSAYLHKPIRSDRWLTMGLDPGLVVGDATAFGDIGIDGVWLSDTDDDWRWSDRDALPLAELTPIEASELLRDLDALVPRT